jgi:DNA primase
MVVTRVRESTGEPVIRERVRPRTNRPEAADRPRPDDPRLALQREALKAALQLPAVAGPAYDELATEAFTHPAYVALHAAVLAAGGTAGGAARGLTGPAWLEAVSAECPTQLRGLVTELAVEPLRLPRKHSDEARYVTSVVAGVRLARVEAQVAELKSKLQRMSPEAEGYHALFGDLVPLEQYRIALRDKAMGTVE